MNLIDAMIERPGDTSTSVKLRSGMVVETAVDARAARAGDAVTLGIRPEDLALTSGERGIGATIALVEWLGNMRFAYLTTDVSDEPLVMQLAADQRFHEGQQVSVSPDSRNCHLFDAAGAAFDRPARPPGSLAA